MIVWYVCVCQPYGLVLEGLALESLALEGAVYTCYETHSSPSWEQLGSSSENIVVWWTVAIFMNKQ